MEISHEEKQRIIEEEKIRYEARKELMVQSGKKSCGCGSCGVGSNGACGCSGFWKGLILGVVLAAIVGFVINHHCGGDRCHYGSTMMQNQAPAEPPQK